MKVCAAIFLLAVFSGSALAQTTVSSKTAHPSRTELRIAAANEAIRKEPEKYQAYDDLAYNLVKLSEETSDRSNLAKADAALAKSFAIAPQNFLGEKTHVCLLLEEHEYSKALDEAKTLNFGTPDDVLLWGYLAEAQSALGDYDGAEKSAQWMLNLRPGNVPGLLQGADLRAVWGDYDGAREYLSRALQETPDFESGDVAAILTKMAGVQFANGKIEDAEKLDEQALNTFPDYYAALENLGRVRVAQHRCAEAVELFVKQNAGSPRPESLYSLAEALECAGRSDEAKRVYAEFERQAHDEINDADNANRELIFYYTDHAANPAEALRIANLEAAQQHDVYTLDALAWALYANQDYAGAHAQMERVLADGVRDSAIFFHAGAIAKELNNRAAAKRYLEGSLTLNPFSESAAAARSVMAKLTPESAALRKAE